MRKRRYQSYTCLTLLKQDITDLVTLFQTRLQDVEVVIDGRDRSDIAQREPFDPAYQAQSFLARGSVHELSEAYALRQDSPQRIELKMTKMAAVLSWEESGRAEPEVLEPIRNVLMRCLKRRQQWIIAGGSWMMLGLPSALLSVWHQHHLSFSTQLLLTVGAGCLSIPAALLLSALLVRRLKLETLIVLLPGAERTTRVYGWREAWGRLIVNISVLMCLVGGMMVALDFLWRWEASVWEEGAAYTNLSQTWQGLLNGTGVGQQYLSCDSGHLHQLTWAYPVRATCVTAGSTTASYSASYDAWGNLSSRSYNLVNATLSYNVLDELVQWDAGSHGQEQYAYDASGERVVQRSTSGGVTSLTTYAFGLEEHTYDNTGTNTANKYYFILGGRLVAQYDGSTYRYMMTDGLGSVLVMLDNIAGAAQLLGGQLYGPYGNTRYQSG